MLHYAVVFFVVALVAVFFGFSSLAAGAIGVARLLCVVFLIGAIITLIVARPRA
jgi:uncharacterized membrane protein YtjA (UPF0391 family)